MSESDSTTKGSPAKTLESAGQGSDPDVKERARAAGVSLEDLQELGQLYLLSATPAARAMLRLVVRELGASRETATVSVADVDALWPPGPLASIRLEFLDPETKEPASAHLYAGECKTPHDLGSELERLRSRLEPSHWPKVLQSLSVLLNWVRKVYAEGAARLADRCPALRDYATLQVDSRDSTLYAREAWPQRIGLFVHLGDTPPV